MNKLIQIITNKKTPLVLMVLGQSYSLYFWQMATYTAHAFTTDYITMIIAILTAFALDLATMHIAFANKTRTPHWIIALITSLALTALGVMITYTTTHDILHASFTVGIFFYSWYSAMVLQDNAHSSNAPDALTVEDVINAVAPMIADAMQAAQNANAPRVLHYTNAEVQKNAKEYACPKCNAPLKQRSYYNAKGNGYCSKCKGI